MDNTLFSSVRGYASCEWAVCVCQTNTPGPAIASASYLFPPPVLAALSHGKAKYSSPVREMKSFLKHRFSLIQSHFAPLVISCAMSEHKNLTIPREEPIPLSPTLPIPGRCPSLHLERHRPTLMDGLNCCLVTRLHSLHTVVSLTFWCRLSRQWYNPAESNHKQVCGECWLSGQVYILTVGIGRLCYPLITLPTKALPLSLFIIISMQWVLLSVEAW